MSARHTPQASADRTVSGSKRHANRQRADLTLFTNLAIPALGSISGVLLARALGPAERGELAVILAAPVILAALSSAGMSEAVAYFIARSDNARTSSSILRSASIIGSVAALIGLLIALGFAKFVLVREGTEIARAGALAAIYVPPLVIVLLAQGWYRGHDNLRMWNAFRLLPTTTWALAVVALSFGQPRLETTAFAFAVSGLLAGVIATPPLIRALRVRSPTRAMRARVLLGYGMPSAASAVPRTLNLRIDQLVLIGFVPANQLGLYVTAVAWTAVISAFGSVAAMRKFAVIAGHEPEGRTVIVRQVYRRCILVTLLVAGALGAVTPALFTTVFGEEYHGGILVSLALLPAGVLLSLMTVSTTLLWATARTKALLAVDSSALLLTVGLLLLLVPSLGIYGAVIASTVAYFAAVAFGAGLLLRARSPGR